jgi:hypothetical protein
MHTKNLYSETHKKCKKHAPKKYKKMKKTQKLQKSHQKCQKRYIGDNRYIAGVFTILVIPDNQLSPYRG